MLKKIIESIKSKDIKPGMQILVDGKWFVVEEVDGDIIWASNDDGEEFEFKVKDIEKVEK